MKLGNEPAHPKLEYNYSFEKQEWHYELTGGMTKREAYVMAAMQGLLADHSRGDWIPEGLAKQSVMMADACLEMEAKTRGDNHE